MNTPCCWLAGWEFVLQRCTKAIGMDIDIMGDTDDVSQAKQLMDGITMHATLRDQHRTSSAFASLKELRISWKSRTTHNCDSQLASHMALASMAAAFHSLEVRARQPESRMRAQSAVPAVGCYHEHFTSATRPLPCKRHLSAGLPAVPHYNCAVGCVVHLVLPLWTYA